MTTLNYRTSFAAMLLTLTFGAPLAAQEQEPPAEHEMIVPATTPPMAEVKQPASELESRATKLLAKQMAEIPAKRIPLYIRRTSRCIAVFPSVYKAGIIIAGQRGQGLVTCRHKGTDEWGSPAYFNFTAASVGLQAGIQQASIVMIALTRNGVEAFLNEDIEFDGNVSLSAGPVGGNVSRGSVPAVVSYVRTRGLFAGVDLSGANISFAKKANAAAYGDGVSVNSILLEKQDVPAALLEFHQTLTKFAPKSSETSPDEE